MTFCSSFKLRKNNSDDHASEIPWLHHSLVSMRGGVGTSSWLPRGQNRKKFANWWSIVQLFCRSVDDSEWPHGEGRMGAARR